MEPTADSGPSTLTPGPVPIKDPAHELATEIGLAVLATLSKAAAEGRLPADLSTLGSALSAAHGSAALERRPASAAAATPPNAAATRPKKPPGTRTIRLLIRGVSELARTPSQSELAHYRVALIGLLVILTMFAGVMIFNLL